MFKRFLALLPILFLSALFVAPPIASAHVVIPATPPTCYQEECDNIVPAGTNCPSGDTLLQTVTVKDHDGYKLGDLRAYKSVLGSGCGTYWVTFYATSTGNSHTITVTTTERSYDDSNRDYSRSYTYGYANQYYDGPMHGNDAFADGGGNECFIGGIDGTDYANVAYHFNVATYCFSA